ncbi:MAG TPA: magnesium transporter CorA family protein [Anaerolineae bacterium]
MSEHRYYHVSEKNGLTAAASLAEAQAAAARDGFIWLNYYRPAKDDLDVLIEPLGLHPLSVEDCIDSNQVPKIDDYPSNSFVIFNALHYADRQLTIDEVDLFIGPNFLVTVSGAEALGPRPLDGIERIVRTDIDSAQQGPAFLMHVILDYVVDRKFAAIEALEDDLDAAEDAMMGDLEHFSPAELLRLRRELLALRKSLFHEREILVKICRLDCPFIGQKAIFHYRDIYDHLAKFFELTETYRDIVTSLMEMYLSMLNNQMARVANETNVTVRRLTFITTIFMPLTLLAGIGGMSEWSMMTGPEHWRIAYPAFVLAMAVLGVASFFFLRWLERRGKAAR